MDSFTFTVGKLDAGMAILIGERAHLIEFPSLLLPPGVTSGSIVNIAVHRNLAEEKRQRDEFWQLQTQIQETFGMSSPKPPQLQVRNTTQTSATLEWPPIELATAKLRSLDIYKNGQRLATIPSPLQNTSTKLSGLELNTQYTLQLILRTTAGTYPSNVVKIKTHTMSDTSGISVCFGNVEDKVLLENAKLVLQEMRAKWSDKVQIDTTHFVCTTPAATPSGAHAAGNVSNAPGVEYQKALQASIPVVQPHWILSCHQEQKMVPISSFYLGSTTSATIQSKPFVRPSTSSKSPTTSPSSSNAQVNTQNIAQFVNQASSNPPKSPETRARTLPDNVEPLEIETLGPRSPPSRKEPAQISVQDEDDPGSSPKSPTSGAQRTSKQMKRRTGGLQKDFRFPPTSSSPVSSPVQQRPPSPPTPPLTNIPTVKIVQPSMDITPRSNGSGGSEAAEIPPPPPASKDRPPTSSGSDIDDDVGETEEVDLS